MATQDENKYLIIHPEEAEIVRLIFEKFIAGNTAIQIRNYLNSNNIPTRQKSKNKDTTYTHPVTKSTTTTTSNSKAWRYTTITGIIKNTIYKGERVFNDEVYNAPIIIPPIEWEQANKLFKPNRGKNTEHIYLLTPLLQCGCGKLINGRSHEIENYYVCGGKRVPKHKCNGRFIPEDFLNGLVIHIIYSNLYESVKTNLTGNNDERKAELKKQLTRIKTEISKVGQSQNRIDDYLADGTYNKEQYQRQFKRLQEKIKDLQIQEGNIREELNSLKDSTELLSEITLLQENYTNAVITSYEDEILEFDAFENSLKAEIIVKEISFNEIQKNIRKYIESISIKYHENQKINEVIIIFKLPIPNETYYIKKGNKSVINKSGKTIIFNLRLLKKKLDLLSKEDFPVFIEEQTNPDEYYKAIDKFLERGNDDD